MPESSLLTLAVVFVAVALFTGSVAWLVMSRSAASRRRLSGIVRPQAPRVIVSDKKALTDTPAPFWDRLADTLPTSFGSVKRLHREMAMAGFHSVEMPALFSMSE